MNLETWTNLMIKNKCFTLPTHLSLSENVCLNYCLYLQIQQIIIIYYVLIEQLWMFFERASPTNPCHNVCWPALSLCSYNCHIFAMQIHHGSTNIYKKLASFCGTFQNSRPAANQNPLENVLASASTGRDRLPIRANWVLLVVVLVLADNFNVDL